MSDFIKYDFCQMCCGEGFIEEEDQVTRILTTFTKVQCPECEHLHELEVRADRLHDEMKED